MRVRITFRKEQGARFLSHLDLIATFEYALRRGAFPVELSEGFNPRPRISLAAPLALGHVGEAEILEMGLRESLPTAEVGRRLQSVLPPGIAVSAVEEMPAGEKLSASRLCGAIYRIELQTKIDDLASRLAKLLEEETLAVIEQRQHGTRSRDLRPLIRSLSADAEGRVLRVEVRMDTEGSVRPEQVLDFLGIEKVGTRITRERLLLSDSPKREEQPPTPP